MKRIDKLNINYLIVAEGKVCEIVMHNDWLGEREAVLLTKKDKKYNTFFIEGDVSHDIEHLIYTFINTELKKEYVIRRIRCDYKAFSVVKVVEYLRDNGLEYCFRFDDCNVEIRKRGSKKVVATGDVESVHLFLNSEIKDRVIKSNDYDLSSYVYFEPCKL